MDIKDLELFRSITNHMNLTKAARELNYVQSNVTSRLAKIEKEIGKKLLTRTNRGVYLTTEGKLFSEYVIRMIQLYNEMINTMQNPDLISGQLSIGSTDITTASRLPCVLATFLEESPKVEFSLVNGSSEDLIQDVMKYRIDGAFITDTIDEPKFIQEKLIEEEVVLISNKSHPPIYSLRELRKSKILVFNSGCTYRRKIEEWVAKEGVIVQKVVFGTIEGMIGCVKAGFGVALVSKLMAEQINKDAQLQIHKVPEEYRYVTTVFIRRKDIPITNTLDQFLNITRDKFNQCY